jgi:hypothetical protein
MDERYQRNLDYLPDVRDGLTRLERIILHVLYEARKEYGDRQVPSALVYGRVVELIDITPAELQAALARLNARPSPSDPEEM